MGMARQYFEAVRVDEAEVPEVEHDRRGAVACRLQGAVEGLDRDEVDVAAEDHLAVFGKEAERHRLVRCVRRRVEGRDFGEQLLGDDVALVPAHRRHRLHRHEAVGHALPAQVGVPGRGLGDEVGDLRGDPDAAVAVGERGIGHRRVDAHLGVGVERFAGFVDAGEVDQQQRALVDHRADAAEWLQPLTLLSHRFAADVGDPLAAAQPVGQEFKRGIDEFLPAVETPAGVSVASKIAPRVDAPMRPHPASSSSRTACD